MFADPGAPASRRNPEGDANSWAVRSMSDVRWLKRNADLAGANAAIFDAVYGFAGCLPGIHEILRCQGIFEAVVCLESARKIV